MKKLLVTGLSFAIAISSLASIKNVKADNLTKAVIYLTDGDTITYTGKVHAVNNGTTELKIDDTYISEAIGKCVSKITVMSDFTGADDKISLSFVKADNKDYKPYSQSFGKTANGYSYCTALFSKDFCKIGEDIILSISSEYDPELIRTPNPDETDSPTATPEIPDDNNPVLPVTSASVTITTPTPAATTEEPTETPVSTSKPLDADITPVEPTETPKVTSSPTPTSIPNVTENPQSSPSSNPVPSPTPSPTTAPVVSSDPNVPAVSLSLSNKTGHKGYKYYSYVQLKFGSKSTYTIYRQTGEKGTFKKIKTIKGKSYNDKTAVKGKIYYYMIMSSGKRTVIKHIKSSKKMLTPSYKVKTKGSSFKITFKKAEGDKIQAKYKYKGKKTWSDLSALNCSLKRNITKTLKTKGFTLKIRTVKKSGGKYYYSKWVTKKI